jgi:hypothetical protein
LFCACPPARKPLVTDRWPSDSSNHSSVWVGDSSRNSSSHRRRAATRRSSNSRSSSICATAAILIPWTHVRSHDAASGDAASGAPDADDGTSSHCRDFSNYGDCGACSSARRDGRLLPLQLCVRKVPCGTVQPTELHGRLPTAVQECSRLRRVHMVGTAQTRMRPFGHGDYIETNDNYFRWCD